MAWALGCPQSPVPPDGSAEQSCYACKDCKRVLNVLRRIWSVDFLRPVRGPSLHEVQVPRVNWFEIVVLKLKPA